MKGKNQGKGMDGHQDQAVNEIKQLSIGLHDPQNYFSRELSWLEFNARVLHEAMDDRTPLLERLKFMGIFSVNLDEFFMVRVATIKQQIASDVQKTTPDGRTPEQQLQAIGQRLRPLLDRKYQHFEKELRPLIANQGIHILNYFELNQEQRQYLQSYFEDQIFPVLTPLAVDPSHPFPYISNLSLSLAVVLKHPENAEELFARLKVPQVLPRFIQMPSNLCSQFSEGNCQWTGIPIEQLIAHNLDSLFPGMNIQECHVFRVTRNADIAIAEDDADDLLLAIEQELRKRRLGGSVVRVEVQAGTPEHILQMLMEELDLAPSDVYKIDGLLGLSDLFAIYALNLPDLKDIPWTPSLPPRLKKLAEAEEDDDQKDFFSVIAERDLLVHHPYQSFTGTVEKFVTAAALDPSVMAIKMTLYRTSGDSKLITALMTAAENGKQVAVLVELKARFDEQNNIAWARQLEQSGVHVVYGLVGLKTHTKVILVVRQEGKTIRRYVHIGTGNYNAKTSRIYTDLGLFSSRPELGADLTDLFNYLTGYSRQQAYRKLLISPVNAREQFAQLIQQEIEQVQTGDTGRIVAKMNSLVDPAIIALLYQASQAGVSIDLIVRGMCCLRPGIPGLSENIRVMSIIGRFLEHSRIYYFYNGGDQQVLIGSADWMTRNLDRRVEAIVPIEDPDIARDIHEMLGIMLADNRQAWDLQSDGSYVQRQASPGGESISSHQILMDMNN
jgi:polyphosphate kinase